MKNIYIAPFYLHANLFSILKKNDVFFNAKIITKEELIGQLYGKVDCKYVPILMEKYNITPQLAKEILSYIPFVNNGETKHLEFINNIKKDVVIKKNEYIDQFFKDSKVKVVGYSKFDKELVNALNTLKLDYSFDNEFEKTIKNVTVYKKVEDEVFGTLNQIADLIYNGENINNILVYTRSQEHLYYFEKYAKSFGFAVNIASNETYLSFETSKLFLEQLRNGLSPKEAYEFVLNKEENEELLEPLKKYIELSEGSLTHEQIIDYIHDDLKTIKVHNPIKSEALNVTDNPILNNNAHVFILGFNQGSIPKSFKDNAYLTDKEKEMIGLNTSKDKFLMDEDLISRFIFSKNNINISRFINYKTNSHHPSFLISKYNFTVSEYKFPEVIYSKDMIEYYAGKYKDLFTFYRETSPEYFGFKNLAKTPYFTYNNAFSGAEVIKPNQVQNYSYSSLKAYNECPFKYYLGKHLKVDPYETNFNIKVGNIVHHIFEHQLNEAFDFEHEWNEAIAKDEFTKKELTFLKNLKRQIKTASEQSVTHYKEFMGSKEGVKSYKNELSLKMQLNKNTFIRGAADKVIILNNQYVIVVDYKTGSESFNPKDLAYGKSMQLPTYSLLLANSEEYQDYKVVGLYINNVISNSLKDNKGENENSTKHLKLKGVTLNDIDVVKLIDNTVVSGTANFIHGVGLKKDGGFKASNSIISEQEFENYQQIAFEFYNSKDLSIRNNYFEIEPKFFDSNSNACKYCSFRDICYVKESQRVYMSEEAKEEQE